MTATTDVYIPPQTLRSRLSKLLNPWGPEVFMLPAEQQKLVEEGFIEKLPSGRYAVTDKAHRALEDERRNPPSSDYGRIVYD